MMEKPPHKSTQGDIKGASSLVRGGRGEASIDELVLRFSNKPLFREGLKILESDLPTTLRYHSAEHTHEVIHDALLFALEDKIDEAKLELLAAAALYHDLGFVQAFDDNEHLGAQLAAAKMREHGYSEEDIALVERLILDTKMYISPSTGAYEQRPQAKLSKYLCDADLGNLGTKFFLSKALSLFAEIHQREVWGASDIADDAGLEFLKETRLFLNCHSWQTPAARRLREEQKARNIKELDEFIASVEGLRAD